MVLFLANWFPRLCMDSLPQIVGLGGLFWILLAMIPQMFMGVFCPILGPDIQTGLILLPHLLLYYGVFFCCWGKGLWKQAPSVTRISLGSCLACGTLDPVAARKLVTRIAVVWRCYPGAVCLADVLGIDCPFCATTSIKKRFWLSYLSDASYFLYLMHFPWVLIGLSWVRPWQVLSLFKIFLVCALSTAYLLFIFQCLVRNTWLGRLWNGRRGGTPR